MLVNLMDSQVLSKHFFEIVESVGHIFTGGTRISP